MWVPLPVQNQEAHKRLCDLQAFGAIGSLESAYFRATGKQLLMSEQHLMDCSWDYGNSACFGGFQTLAFQWLLEQGGVATEEDYPYQGSTNYCNRNATLGPRFKVTDWTLTLDIFELLQTSASLLKAGDISLVALILIKYPKTKYRAMFMGICHYGM